MDAQIIDLGYGGRAGVLGAWLHDRVLIDCGPTPCLERLLAGLGERMPKALLLTHVHSDHAGAAGALVERWPELPVFVHPLGVPHLADPTRLIKSARRVFGERFEQLVGEVTAVPPANLRALADGDETEGLRSAWTPGHASHHVAFIDRAGLAFPGDVAGVKLTGGVIVPPTPPPDIDLDRWRSSLEVLEASRPQRLALPHFGLVERPLEHIALLREALDRHERWAGEGERAFVERLREHLSARMPASAVEDYMFISLAEPSAVGLRLWLERREELRR